MDQNPPAPDMAILKLIFDPRHIPTKLFHYAKRQTEDFVAAFPGTVADAAPYHLYARNPFSTLFEFYAEALKIESLIARRQQILQRQIADIQRQIEHNQTKSVGVVPQEELRSLQEGIEILRAESQREALLSEMDRSPEAMVLQVLHVHAFLGLLRREELVNLEKRLDPKTHPCMDAIYFLVGFYHRAEELKLESWQKRKHDLVPSGLNYDWLHNHPQALGSPDVVSTDELTREERHRLCFEFEALGLIGNSDAMIALFKRIDDLADRICAWPENLATVLIYGEPGSGKELVARAIHARSGRPGKFIAVNCAAISKDLFESELFGHEVGAFTGATGLRKGIFEEAQGGTVFLDELSKMPVDQQGKLLRVLENKEARRVGSSENYSVKVLVVTATNEDLQEKVKRGEFLADLYSRLHQPALVVPPLRNRTEDIPLLVNHILQRRFPGTTADQYRFPLALFCESQVTAGSSVRDLINLIDEVVTKVGKDCEEDQYYSRLLQAVVQAEGEGFYPPFTRANLAKRMRLSRSNLSSPPWKPSVDRLVQEGKVKP